MTPAELLPPAASVRGAVLRASLAALIVALLLACMPEAVEEPTAEPPATETAVVAEAPAETAAPDAAEVVAVEAPGVVVAGGTPEAGDAAPANVSVEEQAAPAGAAEPGAAPAEAVEDSPPVRAGTAAKPAVTAPAAPEAPLVLQPPPHPQTVQTHPVVPVRPPGQEDLPLTVAQAEPPPAPMRPPGPAPKPAAKPAPKPAPQPAAAPAFRLQLGGYMPRAAARELHEAARAAGYPTRMLHRVVVGPYATREAALSAQKQLSADKTILIRGAGDKEWWLQAGVFSDGRNAESLHAALAAGSAPVSVHARVLAGPYSDRAAAEQVLIALRTALERPLADAEIVAVR